MLDRVGDVVLAADHVGDAHLSVVYDDGEVVEVLPVCLADHEVGEMTAVLFHLATDQIDEADLAFGYAKTPDWLTTLSGELFALGLGYLAALARVFGWEFLRLLLRALRCELIRRTVAGVDRA